MNQDQTYKRVLCVLWSIAIILLIIPFILDHYSNVRTVVDKDRGMVYSILKDTGDTIQTQHFTRDTTRTKPNYDDDVAAALYFGSIIFEKELFD